MSPVSSAARFAACFVLAVILPLSGCAGEKRLSTPLAGNDSCQHANDGECDEPNICSKGTDATDCSNEEEGRIRVSVEGVGEVEAKPDHAIVNAALVVREDSADAAKRKMEALMAGLADEFFALGMTEDDIAAESVELSPVRDHEGNKVIGYLVEREIKLTLRNADRVGPATNLLARHNEARIGGVSYHNSRADKLREQALLKAMDNSRQRAGLVAGKYGMTLGKPARISLGEEDSSQYVQRIAVLTGYIADTSSERTVYLPEPQTYSMTVNVVFYLHH